jgi:hypothetical protein
MLKAEIRPPAQVREREMKDLFTLMHRHYAGLVEDRFRRDFLEKTGVILLRDPGGDLRGFSTFAIYETRVCERDIRVLYSGDTVISREHWGGFALFDSFGGLLRLLMEQEDREGYWFLISKGYRTYLLLPLFFREFYPCYDRTTPRSVVELIEALAQERFGAAFDANAGVVRHTVATDHLRPDFAGVPDRRRGDQHIEYFLKRNPAYHRGDELACLARVTRENMTPRAHRFLRGDGAVRPVGRIS